MSSASINGHDPDPGQWHPDDVAAAWLHASTPSLAPGGEREDDGGAEWEAGPGATAGPVRWDQLTVSDPQPPLGKYIAQGRGAVTVVFGDGGAGKGTLAAYTVAQLSREGKRTLIIDAEGHPGEWARRLSDMGADMTMGAYWEWRSQQLLRDEAEDYQGLFDLVVVDSAAYFPGPDGDYWGPQSAVAMQDAAKVMGIPMLVLAHVSKQSQQGKAYGSGFWHNVPRISMELEQGTLTCRKASDIEGLRKGDRFTITPRYKADDFWQVRPIGLDIDGPE